MHMLSIHQLHLQANQRKFDIIFCCVFLIFTLYENQFYL